jgi:hypothetical protein
VEAFKHVPLPFAEAFEAGTSIQIGPLEYYRRLESDRADKLEGIAEYAVSMATPEQLESDRYADVREALMLPRGPLRGAAYFGNVVQHLSPPYWIFCASLEPDNTRVGLGEAIFRITDLELFAHRVSMKSPIDLGCMTVRTVVYEQRSQDPFESGLLEVGPFQKALEFQFENEVRAVWSSPAPSGAAPFQVEAPKVSRLIKRIA